MKYTKSGLLLLVSLQEVCGSELATGHKVQHEILSCEYQALTYVDLGPYRFLRCREIICSGFYLQKSGLGRFEIPKFVLLMMKFQLHQSFSTNTMGEIGEIGEALLVTTTASAMVTKISWSIYLSVPLILEMHRWLIRSFSMLPIGKGIEPHQDLRVVSRKFWSKRRSTSV